TFAQIGRGATVDAAGKLSVLAHDTSYLATVAGAVASSQSVGVGMSVGINSLDRSTQALIGDYLDASDGAASSAPAGSVTAQALKFVSQNGGFAGSLSIAGSRLSTPPAGSDAGGTGGSGGGTGGTGGTAPGTNLMDTSTPGGLGGSSAGAGGGTAAAGSTVGGLLSGLSGQTGALTQDSGATAGGGATGGGQQSQAGLAVSGS